MSPCWCVGGSSRTRVIVVVENIIILIIIQTFFKGGYKGSYNHPYFLQPFFTFFYNIIIIVMIIRMMTIIYLRGAYNPLNVQLTAYLNLPSLIFVVNSYIYPLIYIHSLNRCCTLKGSCRERQLPRAAIAARGSRTAGSQLCAGAAVLDT